MIAVASNPTNNLFVQQNTYFLCRKENRVSSKATVGTKESKSMSQNMREQLQTETINRRVTKDQNHRLKQREGKKKSCNGF